MGLIFFLIYYSLLLVIFQIPTASQGEPLKTECNNTYTGMTVADYTLNSTFHTNLQLLLPSLSSNSSLPLNKGFYNTSIGRDPERVYGLVLCRGDTAPADCRNCTNFASDGILSRCRSRSSAIWYDLCQLQYSETNFVLSPTTPWWFYAWSMKNMTAQDLEPFKKTLGELMNELADKARDEPRRRLFVTGEKNYSGFNRVYGLVQCKPVISGKDCHKCLEDAIGKLPECCDYRIGGRVVGEVCNLRFEIYSFYGNSPSPARTGGLPKLMVILIPVIAAVTIILLISFIVLWWKRERLLLCIQTLLKDGVKMNKK